MQASAKRCRAGRCGRLPEPWPAWLTRRFSWPRAWPSFARREYHVFRAVSTWTSSGHALSPEARAPWDSHPNAGTFLPAAPNNR